MTRLHSRFVPSASRNSFTLVELLVSMAVLTLLMLVIAQLFSAATIVITGGNKHMDADAQARPLLDRMAFDISKMIKRNDVDYFLKQPSTPQTGGNGIGMNDQIAFYSEVPGYYPTTGSQSPVSLVAYRVNADTNSSSYNKLERLSKGLVWNGVSATDTPMVFLPIPVASPLPSPLPSPMPSSAPTPAWPQAASATTADPDYELVGPQVFRFEYFYILKGQQASTSNPSIASDTPWDTRAPLSHTSVSGLQDVAAIAVVLAVMDPKSRALLSESQLAGLAGQMKDFANTMNAGDLEAQWQAAVNASAIPRVAASSIRIYHRYFYLNSPSP